MDRSRMDERRFRSSWLGEMNQPFDDRSGEEKGWMTTIRGGAKIQATTVEQLVSVQPKKPQVSSSIINLKLTKIETQTESELESMSLATSEQKSDSVLGWSKASEMQRRRRKRRIKRRLLVCAFNIAFWSSFSLLVCVCSRAQPTEGALSGRPQEAAATVQSEEAQKQFTRQQLTTINGAQPSGRTKISKQFPVPVTVTAAATGTGTARDVNEQQEERAAHWSLPNRPSLFSIIRFPNEECFDSSNQSGTCYTAFECKLLGGQPSSPCAAGFGSCCIVSRTCHVTTREKVVYFKNPSYPSADSDEKFCDLTVELSDINVCQLRLDFLDFQLDPPTNGACKDDYMEISASGMPPQTVPRLCGLNRNQHLYITVPQELNERSASIVFYTDPVGDHRWQLKVTQIDCHHYRPFDWRKSAYGKLAASPLWQPHPNSIRHLPAHLLGTKYSTTFASGFQTMSQTASALAYEFLKPQFTPRAPMGCLQYFTQPSGIIESFNFGQYLNNMDYSICIQRQADTCRVVFTSSDYDWSLNGVGVSSSSSGVGDQDCARDYLLIPGASRTGDGFTYDRYCGGRLHYYRGQSLSAPVVIKTSGPIVLRFHSDSHFESMNNGGFRLQYDQSAQDCFQHSPEESGSLSSQQLLASTLSDSRPLSSLAASPDQGPVLYASQQQLNLTPQSQFGGHLDLSLGAGSANGTSVNNNLLIANQQQQVDRNGNMRRRNDYDYTANNEQEIISQQQQWSGPLASGSTYSRPVAEPNWLSTQNGNTHSIVKSFSLADLSKAFQLITSSSGSTATTARQQLGGGSEEQAN